MDERTEEERHHWIHTKRERGGGKPPEGKPPQAVLYCSRCGLTVGAALGDVIRPTCAERIVRFVMDS